MRCLGYAVCRHFREDPCLMGGLNFQVIERYTKEVLVFNVRARGNAPRVVVWFIPKRSGSPCREFTRLSSSLSRSPLTISTIPEIASPRSPADLSEWHPSPNLPHGASRHSVEWRWCQETVLLRFRLPIFLIDRQLTETESPRRSSSFKIAGAGLPIGGFFTPYH